MMATSIIGGATRRALRVIVGPTAMLLLSLTLPGGGDKEAPINSAHRLDTAEARARYVNS
jgi:hypothetical protein